VGSVSGACGAAPGAVKRSASAQCGARVHGAGEMGKGRAVWVLFSAQVNAHSPRKSLEAKKRNYMPLGLACHSHKGRVSLPCTVSAEQRKNTTFAVLAGCGDT